MLQEAGNADAGARRPCLDAARPPILELVALTRRFGGLTAVERCSFAVQPGRIAGVIGPNGAGKTTLFNLVAGAIAPSSGRILFDGEDVTGLPTHTLFHRGIVRTFQIPQEFGRLTVLENLMAVPAGQPGERLWPVWLSPGAVASRERDVRRQAEEVLGLLTLWELRDELAMNLSGGQKKLLELGRAMMTAPRLVLLDEPGAGVNPSLLARLRDVILTLSRERGVAFVVIGHDMDFIASLCERVTVLSRGSVVTEGPMETVRADARVLEAYLGDEETGARPAPGPAPSGGERGAGERPILELAGVSGGYGGAEIIHDVSVRVGRGEIVVLVGPNGAGKSTVMNAVLGRIRLDRGRVSLRGRDITNSPPAGVVRRGVCYVPQTGNVFLSLTVDENLEMGAYIRKDGIRRRMDEMFALFPPLAERRRARAWTLSGGQRQMVAIAKALMLEPVVLLLDEPTAGLSPRSRGDIFRVMREINARGTPILMVEQNARQALAIADRGYVLVGGRNRMDGTGPALLADPDVGAMFLGGRDGARPRRAEADRESAAP